MNVYAFTMGTGNGYITGPRQRSGTNYMVDNYEPISFHSYIFHSPQRTSGIAKIIESHCIFLAL